MDDFPSNSRRREPEKAPTPPPKKQEEKKVEKVTTGEVISRKKPLGKRMKELLVGGDANSVGRYVFFEVLLPAAKDTIADVVTQGVERMIFGEARSTSRRTGSRPGGSSGYTSYNRYYSTPPWDQKGARREEPRREISRRARSSHDFDEIILATRAEANEVLDRLFDLVSRYDQATVSDLYELVGLSGNFVDEKWGWTDLRGSGVTRVTDGYLLDLPRPESLD